MTEEASVSWWQHKPRPPLLFQTTPRLNIKILQTFSQGGFLSSCTDPIRLMPLQGFALLLRLASIMIDSWTLRRRPWKPGNRYRGSISWFNSPGRILSAAIEVFEMTAVVVRRWDVISSETRPPGPLKIYERLSVSSWNLVLQMVLLQ